MDPSIEDVVVRAQRSRLPRAVENGDGDTITTSGTKPVAALRSFQRIRGVSDADLAGFVDEGRH